MKTERQKWLFSDLLAKGKMFKNGSQQGIENVITVPFSCSFFFYMIHVK